MEFIDFLSPDAIIPMLKVESKKQAIQEMAARLAELSNLPERDVFDVLLQRERLGSTAVGEGIAIPHGKLVKADKLMGLFARLEKPIEFDSLDDRPVDLVFVLITPESAGADHLKALSRIARLLRNKDVAKKLRKTSSDKEIFTILTETPDPESS